MAARGLSVVSFGEDSDRGVDVRDVCCNIKGFLWVARCGVGTINVIEKNIHSVAVGDLSTLLGPPFTGVLFGRGATCFLGSSM